MLDLMRKHARSWFIQVVLFIVILVFVFWGVGSFREGKTNRVATVNDYPITISQYQSAYENLVKRYRDIYSDRLTEELMDMLNLKEVALEGLIARALLLQEAERLNLEITKKELRDSIRDFPTFQKEGVFNNTQYLRLLRRYRMTPSEFEEAQRADLLVKKIEDIIKDNVKVSHREILDAYTMERESVKAEFVKVATASFLKKASVSDEDVTSYFSNHKKDYEIPTKVKIRYLSFNGKDYEPEVKITDGEITDYYELNIKSFTLPETVRIRHILIKTLPGDDSASVKKAREKAEGILKKIRKGWDFATLASKYSDDPSAKKGGDLGYLEKAMLGGSIGEAVSSLDIGGVSSVIESPYGFHVIKVEDIKKARTKPLNEVKAEITSILTRETAQELADEDAENVYARIFDEENLEQFASGAKIELHETGFFARGESIKGVGSDKVFFDAAFALDEGEMSDVIRSSGVNCILELIKRQSPRIPELREVEKNVQRDVQIEKAKAMAKAKAEKLLEELRAGEEWKRVVSKNSLKAQETGFFTRAGSAIPKIGSSQEIKEEVFSLTPDTPYADKVFEVNDTYFVIRLKGKKGIDKKKFEQEDDDFAKVLVEQKKQELFNAWLNNLKAKAEIERKLSLTR